VRQQVEAARVKLDDFEAALSDLSDLDKSQVSVGGLLALNQVLGKLWSVWPTFGLRHMVEEGAPRRS
jgi:hypothetical protein